jgi:hypothetical protein
MFISVRKGHFRVLVQARPIITQKDRQRYGLRAVSRRGPSRELVSTAIPLGFTMPCHDFPHAAGGAKTLSDPRLFDKFYALVNGHPGPLVLTRPLRHRRGDKSRCSTCPSRPVRASRRSSAPRCAGGSGQGADDFDDLMTAGRRDVGGCVHCGCLKPAVIKHALQIMPRDGGEPRL